jgi:hypothetical protein
MGIDSLHRLVAQVALDAAAEHGFALAGGNALLAHQLGNRPTQDVDLFTNRADGVEAAVGRVEAALRAAGFRTNRVDKAAELTDIFGSEMGAGLAEWTVIAADGRQMTLQMAYFDRGREPVVMEIGPVLDLEDVLGGKTNALVQLTELPKHTFHIWGQGSGVVARVLDRDLTRKRTRPGGSCDPACWAGPRDRVFVGALPAG